jgi:predicted PurR-regulated permease PerM
MNQAEEQDRLRKIILVILLLFISAIFVAMVRRFLVVLLLAAIFSAMARPVYRSLLKVFRGRKHVASLSTLILLILVVGLPTTALGIVVVSEALQVSDTVRPWVDQIIHDPRGLTALTERIPGWRFLAPYEDQILTRLGGMVETLGLFIVNNLTAVTKLTVGFLFNLIILLYAMFFFLVDGPAMLAKMLYYLPLPAGDEERMIGRFVSVTRATLKGTLIIGGIQGAMGGVGFWVAGIPSPVFWATMMAVFSLIPGAGTGIIWVPACIILLVTGKTVTALVLAVYMAGVVGSIDNLLRPRLVGRDTQMHELLIMLGTLGGIFLFGAVGVIIGPIVAALFVTIWDLYGTAFRDVLPTAPDVPERPPQL